MQSHREFKYESLNQASPSHREREITKTAASITAEVQKAKKNGGKIVQSVDRAINLLETLARQDTECSLKEISELVGLNISTCHHLLSTLMQRGYVLQVPRTKMYGLGNKIMELAQARIRQIDLIRISPPVLRRLKDDTGETTFLSAIQGRELIELAAIDSDHSVKVGGGGVGKANGAHASAEGKAILAWLPEGEIASIIGEKGMTQFTSNTIIRLGDLLNELALVRRHGYAFDNEEYELGMLSIAAAIRNHSGGVIASIGCALPKTRSNEERLRDITIQVKSAANTLSLQLGSPQKK